MKYKHCIQSFLNRFLESNKEWPYRKEWKLWWQPQRLDLKNKVQRIYDDIANEIKVTSRCDRIKHGKNLLFSFKFEKT